MKTIEIRELSADQISDELIKYKESNSTFAFKDRVVNLIILQELKRLEEQLPNLKQFRMKKINYRRRNNAKENTLRCCRK